MGTLILNVFGMLALAPSNADTPRLRPTTSTACATRNTEYNWLAQRMGEAHGPNIWARRMAQIPGQPHGPNTWAKRSEPEQLTIERAQGLTGFASDNPAPDQDTLETP